MRRLPLITHWTLKNVCSKVQSPVFLKNITVMLDAIEELADLLVSLQPDSMSLPKAHKLIMRRIQVFQARKLNDGENLTAANKAAADLHFKGINLKANHCRSKAPICKEQFYQALVTGPLTAG